LVKESQMSNKKRRRAAAGFGISIAGISLLLLAAGAVTADAGNPATINVSQSGPLTVDASGSWSWAEMATASKLSYAGFAIDWGDVSSGNAVGTYHIGDGTAATNVVMQPTTPAQGASGTWGPVSHTYAKAGTYNVCVIIYDLGQVKPFKTTGYHSLRAGGAGRNVDNSMDQNQQVPAMCSTIDVTGPSVSPIQSFQGETATPFESFQGETATPDSTAPPTSTTGGNSSPDQGVSLLALALLLGSMVGSLIVFKMVKVRA
jgi:hypothetical protein